MFDKAEWQRQYRKTARGKSVERRYYARTRDAAAERQRRYRQTEAGKAVQRRYRQTEAGKAAQRRSNATPAVKAAKQRYAKTEARKAVLLRQRERYPQAYKAHVVTTNAIRDGQLLRQPCEVCGAPKTQAHHSDYAKPLDINWFCVKHHREWHRKNKAKNASKESHADPARQNAAA